MRNNSYIRIAKIMAVVFVLFSIALLVDYFLTKKTLPGTLQTVAVDAVHVPKYNHTTCYITVRDRSLRSNEAGCEQLNEGERVWLDETRLMSWPLSIRSAETGKTIRIYNTPYSYFPLLPLLFILPLLLNIICGSNHIVFVIARPLSFLVAIAALLTVVL